VSTHSVGRDDPGLYEIRLQGRLHERWLAWFDGMTLTCTPDSDGTGVITILRGQVPDQAALHGMLARLRDFGMPLISVARVEPGSADETQTAPTTS
jgi:hypothetical protein